MTQEEVQSYIDAIGQQRNQALDQVALLGVRLKASQAKVVKLEAELAKATAPKQEPTDSPPAEVSPN